MSKTTKMDDETREWTSSFRAAMAYARVKAGLTHADVAERMGVSPETVRRMEDGQTDPYMSTVRRWALGVGVVIHYHLYDVETGQPIISTGDFHMVVQEDPGRCTYGLDLGDSISVRCALPTGHEGPHEVPEADRCSHVYIHGPEVPSVQCALPRGHDGQHDFRIEEKGKAQAEPEVPEPSRPGVYLNASEMDGLNRSARLRTAGGQEATFHFNVLRVRVGQGPASAHSVAVYRDAVKADFPMTVIEEEK